MARVRRTPLPEPEKGDPAWGLVAVSSEQQAETLSHQRSWAKETAASRGWRLVRVFEGVASGKDGPRRVVRELMANLRAHEPELRPKVLLMIRADRLGRGSVVDSQIILRDLRELGVQVYTRDQGFIKLDSAMDELISAATSAVAAHENEIRSEKMAAVYRRRRAAGETIGNRPPYGLLRKNGKLVGDGKRATIVKRAFKLRLQGLGYNAIGKQLRAVAPPQEYRNGRSHPINFTATRIMRMLTNVHYVGTLISEADFARAQRVAETLATIDRSKDRRRRWPWPLGGALRCYCGRMLIGSAGGQDPWRIRYYACRASWAHDVSVRLVRADSLEEQFVNLLKRLRASPELVERYRKKATAPTSPRLLERAAKDLRSKLADLDRKRESAWDLHVVGKVRGDDVQARLDAITTQRDVVQSQLGEIVSQMAIEKARADRSQDVETLFRRAAQIFERATEEEQRGIARAIALELGGLWVSAAGRLEVGKAPAQ